MNSPPDLPKLQDLPKKVLVYGVTGAGKTTLALELASLVGGKATLADDLAFEPGWKTVPEEIQIERIISVCSQDEWILDSAYGKWLPHVLPRVELIICLDYPRLTSFARLLGRTLHRAWTKQPVCNGNTESWKLMFSRESILIWHFKTFKSKRERIRTWASGDRNAYGEMNERCQIIWFRSPSQCDDWIRSLREESLRETPQPQ